MVSRIRWSCGAGCSAGMRRCRGQLGCDPTGRCLWGSTDEAVRWCLVGSALPRAVGVAEEHRDAGGHAEAGVVGHLPALVPGKAAAQDGRRATHRRGQQESDPLGAVIVGDTPQDDVAGGALNEGDDRRAEGPFLQEPLQGGRLLRSQPLTRMSGLKVPLLCQATGGCADDELDAAWQRWADSPSSSASGRWPSPGE